MRAALFRRYDFDVIHGSSVVVKQSSPCLAAHLLVYSRKRGQSRSTGLMISWRVKQITQLTIGESQSHGFNQDMQVFGRIVF